MLLLTAFSRFNQWAGPFVLDRVYLSARSAFGLIGSQPVVDAIVLHPFTKLVSIECHHHYQDDSVVKECMTNGDLVGASERRVRILESNYVKPSVLARHWNAWSTHERFKRWIRSECLLARHGPTIQKSFRNIKISPQFQPKKRRRMWSVLGGDGNNNAASSSSQAPSVASHTSGSEAGMLLSNLPTTKQLEAWLDMKHWTMHKDTEATTRAMSRIARRVGGSTLVSLGGALCVAVLPNHDADVVGGRVDNDGGGQHDVNATDNASKRSTLSELRLEELVELSGGHVQECGPLNALCEHYGQYQVYTREYVQKLGEYLVEQAEVASRPPNSTRHPDVILDVGAGDGLLVQLLNDYFDSHYASSNPIQRKGVPKPGISVPRPLRRGGPSVTVKPRNPIRGKRRIGSTSVSDDEDEADSARRPLVAVATDDGSWRISARAPVERLSVEDALEKYAAMSSADDDEVDISRHRPRVTVLCSWMPMGLDWTAMFRRHNADEYVLVGECEDGQCGHNWETWGNPHFRHDDQSVATDNDEQDDSVGPQSKSTERRDTGTDLVLDASEPWPTPRPPYEVDGYERHDLDFLAPYQFSRYDSRVSKSGRTVSFRRRGAVVVGMPD